VVVHDWRVDYGYRYGLNVARSVYERLKEVEAVVAETSEQNAEQITLRNAILGQFVYEHNELRNRDFYNFSILSIDF
jgi:putative lipase involved disintegration of autophagic bodies